MGSRRPIPVAVANHDAQQGVDDGSTSSELKANPQFVGYASHDDEASMEFEEAGD